MSSSYSPIDETSYTDTAFDAEAMLNGDSNPQVVRQDDIRSDAYQPASAQQAAPSIPDTNPVNPAASYTEPAPQSAPDAENLHKPHGISPIARLFRLIRDSRTVMFIGLIFVVLAGYALIVSISYFAHIGTDQSALLNDDFDPTMIRNAGGPFGAWMAHTLLYNWLGIGSFILIYYVAACGLSMLKVYRPRFWSLTMRCLLTAISLSIICGLATYEFASPIFWGGRHGHLFNENLITLSGIWGALALSVIMGGLVVILYLSELKRVLAIANEGISAYRSRQAERRAERERQRAEEEAERMKREAEQEAIRAAQRAAAEAEQRAKAQAAMEAAAARRAAEMAQAPTMPQPVTQTPVQSPVQPQTVTPEPDLNLFNQDNHISETAGDSMPVANVATEISTTDDIPVIGTVDAEIETVTLDNENENETEDSVETTVQPDDEIAPLFSDSPAEDDVEEDTDEVSPLFSSDGPNTNRSCDIVPAIAPATRPTPQEVLNSEPFDPRADLSHFKFPTLDLLRPAKDNGPSVDVQEMEFNKHRITETLRSYGVEISHIEATIGPTVTLYEIIPAEGVRTRSIKSLGDDLQLSLAALGVRIIAPIPAKGTIGIEVPNKDPQVVSMRSVLESDLYKNCTMELPMALGKTISNDIFMADLAKMPHLLVAGATGMGKSVGLNAIITSLLYKKHPSELKFVLIDPKRVELSLYRKLERHYLASLPGEDAIITDMSKVVTVLNSLCVEMDNRLSLLEQAGARNIIEYNNKFVSRQLNPEHHRFLPYIVLIIDEFADLIIRQGKEIENPVSRLAAVARAAGIHLIIATQRPTVNVITGGIKLNIPGRIAFRVIQGNDSRTILDQLGANQLIGRGDMLFSINGKLERVQCAFIDTPEVSAICDSISEQVGYSSAYELPEFVADGGEGGKLATVGDRDPLFDECARFVVSSDTASTSILQRRYSIGYNRAGKIMDQMEAAGIVGPSQGSKPRQVLVDIILLESILENK
ncbi:MAG: DNA translocase FtsK [Staphylococcus sp.]|nr:DNA translocase FtsK [Staphylococcus sp.]